jgi:hypothetical protein
VPGAFAQSDEELIEKVRTSAKASFLEEPPTTPIAFRDSGLAPSDKQRIMQQVASDTADCLADTTVEYAALYNIPISDLVSNEGTIVPSGDSANQFERMLNDCIALAWQNAGINIADDLE